jgi:hypothetical protein
LDDIGRSGDTPLTEPDVIRYQTDYVRRLLVERHHIYAKVLNPGGSIILTSTARVDDERPEEYASTIGSLFHVELMDLDASIKKAVWEKRISKDELAAMLSWVDGMTSQQAAVYLHATGAAAIRQRRSRGITKLTETMNE